MHLPALHIIQVGSDSTLFDRQAPSDTVARQLAYGRALVRQRPGSHLTVIVLAAPRDAQRYQREHVTFIPIPGRYWLALLHLLVLLFRLNRERAIDVIAPQSPHEEALIAWLAARVLGAGLVVQIHYDLFSEEARRQLLGSGWRGRLRFALLRRVIARASAVRVVGRRTQRELLARHWNQHVQTIPVPISMAHAEVPDVPARTRTVLFVGRLSPEKNLSAWLRVAALVAANDPGVRFLIVGDGPLRHMLQQDVAALGLTDRVQFTGALPYEQLPAVYASVQVLLLTSHYEGFGRVIAEAALFGTPTVTTRVAGAEDLVQDGVTGFVCESGDLDGLARRVVELLHDPALRKHMGIVAEQYIRQQYDPARLVQEWVTLLASAAPAMPSYLSTPRRATLARWQQIAASPYSLLRTLQYERIQGLELKGRILDLGGGQRAGYSALLQIDGCLESINIDSRMQPTLRADLNDLLPLDNGCYDHVICFNTLEHIRNDQLAIRELIRVLKPGGKLHILVPFLYQVHGSPSDYHRHTAFWWGEFLLQHGIALHGLCVEPLMWDQPSSAASLSAAWNREWLLGIPIHRFRTIYRKLLLFGAVLAQARWTGEYLPPNMYTRNTVNYAVGYYISGQKAECNDVSS